MGFLCTPHHEASLFVRKKAAHIGPAPCELRRTPSTRSSRRRESLHSPTPIGPGAPAPEGRLPASPSEREAGGGRGRCVQPARCRLPAAGSSCGSAFRLCRCCRVHVDHHPIVAVRLGASRIRRTATPAVCTALWPLRRSCAWRYSPSSLLPALRVTASLWPPRWTRTLLAAP